MGMQLGIAVGAVT